MTPQELIEQCQKKIEFADQYGFSKAEIMLILPGRLGKRKTKLLAGKGSPRGEILADAAAVGKGSGVCCMFDAREVRDWAQRKLTETDNAQA